MKVIHEGREWHLCLYKNVLWVRKNQDTEDLYFKCSKDGSYSITPSHELHIWEHLFQDIATVKVWTEPEPEWIYAIYGEPTTEMTTVLNGLLNNDYHDKHGCKYFCGYTHKSTIPIGTPHFGVRKLTEGDLESLFGIHGSVALQYGAFRQGEYITGSHTVYSPERCVQIVLELLTPATPAMTLDKLETVEENHD